MPSTTAAARRTTARSSRLVALTLALLVTLSLAATPQAAHADHAGDHTYMTVVDLTFPTDPSVVRFSDTYDACRSGCARNHKAIDIIGPKMTPLYAAVAGVICGIDEDAEDSYGRHVTVCGDDGREYRYLHLNNDTPGTDDGMAGFEHIYAPGIRRGARVARGQFIAYMGDSGNAEATVSHLHWDIFDDAITDPYGDNRINPYPSVQAAYARGDFADGSVVHTDPSHRLAGSDRVGTSTELSAAQYDASEVDHVVLASAGSAHDAIVAGPLAAELRGPVLVNWDDRLDARVATEIRRLAPDRVTIVGAGMSQAVIDAITGLGVPADGIDRIAGDYRFWTSILVAERVWELQGVDGDEPTPRWIEATVTPGEPALYISRSADRSAPARLDGSAFDAGDVRVFLDGVDPDATERISFWIDHTDLDGRPDHTEGAWPYDLAGTRRNGSARAFDASVLAAGSHTISAVVLANDGSTTTVHATFTLLDDAHQGRRDAIVAVGQHPVPGRDWSDSVMASYYGSVTGAPVVLVDATSLPDATLAALTGTDRITIIGGFGAVSEQIGTTLDGVSADPLVRLAGATRYSTATTVTQDLVARRLVSVGHVVAATGHNWPDVVAAGPMAAASSRALVLVDGSGAGGDAETQSWLRSRAEAISDITAIGGGGAVSETTLLRSALSIT